MGYITDGWNWLSQPHTLRALWQFPAELQRMDGNLVRACEPFFDRLGYTTLVRRPWRSDRGRVLFISDHQSALDGFAMSLACPPQLVLRRIMFRLTAQTFGRLMVQRCITVWPRGNYHNLLFRTRGLLDRLVYIMTHRWGPWVQPQLALQRMVEALVQGECLTLLPSGTVGERRWRCGLGGILLEMSRQHPPLIGECFVAPVYLNWQRAKRRVEISAPRLVSFADILAQAPPNSDRGTLTEYVHQLYDTTWRETGQELERNQVQK